MEYSCIFGSGATKGTCRRFIYFMHLTRLERFYALNAALPARDREIDQ